LGPNFIQFGSNRIRIGSNWVPIGLHLNSFGSHWPFSGPIGCQAWFEDLASSEVRSGPTTSRFWELYTMHNTQCTMALYIHAVYTMHNTYRHISSKGELARSVEKVVLDIPLRSALRRYVHGRINGALIDYDGPAL